MNEQERHNPGKGLAIAGESLFLLNLLFPLVALLPLAILYFRHRNNANLLVECHLKQPWITALFSTGLFLVINLVAAWSGAYSDLNDLVSIQSLVALEVYTLLVVLPLTIPGLLGLTKAMAGQCYRYPILGRFL